METQGVAVSAGAAADTAGLGGGVVSLYATPAAGRTLAEVETALDEEVRTFLRDGPSEAELARAKAALAAAAIYAQDSQETLARIFGASLAQGESIEDVVRWQDDIMAVTQDDVVAAARAALDENRSVTGLLLPQEAAP